VTNGETAGGSSAEPALEPALGDKDPRLIPYGTTNLGTPMGLVSGLTVPNPLFFVRSNGPTPVIPPAAWRLQVTGLVARALDLSLADLETLPRRTLTAFLECTGNSRSRFVPEAEGTPWRDDAVGNATWEGVPLAAVLDLAGVRPEAVEVVTQGADFPEMRRGRPVAAARDPDTLLVCRMNGEDLPVPHGGPVRLLVPGWGGIASTKWLVGLELVDRPFAGYYNTERYVLIDAAGAFLGPAREQPVKSLITEPAAGARLLPGPQTVAGYAWSGHGAVVGVEVSTDGGATYAPAEIVLEGGPRSWVRFAFAWDGPPGPARLRARAHDAAGNVQPDTVPWNRHGYLMHAVAEVAVEVG
jgi:DMSO/TMAO reductase YedYZ molybdopterin-dependent catalytic subunit